MRGFQRDNLLFSLCGLNCALCKMQLGGHCPGCGGGEGNQSCAIARCGMAHGVAYCFQCADYPCARYAEGDTADSFVIRRTRGQDVALARAAGVEAYTNALRERRAILDELLRGWNDGRHASCFAAAAALLPCEALQQALAALREAGRRRRPHGSAPGERKHCCNARRRQTASRSALSGSGPNRRKRAGRARVPGGRHRKGDGIRDNGRDKRFYADQARLSESDSGRQAAVQAVFYRRDGRHGAGLVCLAHHWHDHRPAVSAAIARRRAGHHRHHSADQRRHRRGHRRGRGVGHEGAAARAVFLGGDRHDRLCAGRADRRVSERRGRRGVWAACGGQDPDRHRGHAICVHRDGRARQHLCRPWRERVHAGARRVYQHGDGAAAPSRWASSYPWWWALR